MKYLKKFTLIKESFDIESIKDIIEELNDEFDVIDKISDLAIVNGTICMKIHFNRSLLPSNFQDTKKLKEVIVINQKLIEVIDRIKSFNNIEFEFQAKTLFLYFEPGDKIKPLLTELESSGGYCNITCNCKNGERFEVSLDLGKDINLDSAFKLNSDFSCTLSLRGAEWPDVGDINDSEEVQDMITKEFSKYGFEFVRKYQEDKRYLRYGKILWFDFINKNILE